jgi:hypothetical protein
MVAQYIPVSEYVKLVRLLCRRTRGRRADDKHRKSTDKQEEILAELRRVHERLDRLEAHS